VIESQQPRSKHTDTTPIPPRQSALEGMGTLENLPTQSRFELTHRLLSTDSSLSIGVARASAVLKTVTLFIAEYARPMRAKRAKALRLACLNSDGPRGRKLELDQFLSENDFEMFLQNELQLECNQALRFANFVCHQTDRTARGGSLSAGPSITMLCPSRVCSTCKPPPYP
jgi:hypothetical protein